MAAKLKDIASRLNLSPATVSMILNNKGVRIPKETEDLVRRTAEELNYHPNRMAVSLVTKRTMNVALIVPDIQKSFFAELAKYVGDYLKTKQYNLILCSTNYDVQDDIRLLRMLRSRMVDGIIGVFTGEDLEYTREIERVLSDKIGIVMMDKVVSGVTTPYVGTDNFLGGRLAMEHLIENGHRRIAVVTGPIDSVSGRQRLAGSRAALADAGLTLDESLVFAGDYQYGSGYRAGIEIAKRQDITAVFVSNDMMAYGVYKAAQEAGRKIGKDFSVVGFDDLRFSSMLEVPLTSIRQPVSEIAARAVDILLHHAPRSGALVESLYQSVHDLLFRIRCADSDTDRAEKGEPANPLGRRPFLYRAAVHAFYRPFPPITTPLSYSWFPFGSYLVSLWLPFRSPQMCAVFCKINL